jgi:SAM-dependent methyltransferase
LVGDPGPYENFDLVFSFGLARPLGDLDGIWVEMHRHLRPGGILAAEGRLEPDNALFRHVGSRGRIARFRKVD